MAKTYSNIDEILVEVGLTQKWEERGRAEGLEQGRTEIARSALAKGVPLALIHDITGLDMETIKNLQAK